MALTVTQRPDQSNSWVAGYNPVIYKMTRKDYAITAVANSGGALQITVTGDMTALTAAKGGPIVAGSVLWVTTDNGVYNGAYTVVTCTSAASSVITFEANTYTSAATTGYINLAQRTGYYVSVGVYADNGTASTLRFTMKASPTKAGLVTIDVSTLRNYLQPEPFQYLTTTTNGNEISKCRANTLTSYQFYIKYTEVWVSSSGTASAETEVDDTANRSFIVHGARQIGDSYGGYLKEYSEPNATPTRKFLTKFTNPVLWTGRKFTLSYIDSDVSTTARTLIKKKRYDASGTYVIGTYDLPEYAGSTVKSVYEVFEDVTTPYQLLYDKENGAGTGWSNLGTSTPSAVTLATGTSSKMKLYPCHLILGTTYSMTVSVTVAAGAGTDTVKVRLSAITLNGTVRYTVDSANLSQNTTTVLTFSSILPATSDTYYIGIEVIHNGGGNNRTLTINYSKITIPVVNKIDFQIVTLTSTLTATETVVSETLTAYIEDPCDNPIQLYWKNTLGGDSNYLFDVNQIYRTKMSDSKNKRYVCFAPSITLQTLNAIDDLNSLGELYDPAIIELTTSVNKTQGRNGSQVYSVDSSGNKIGVIVIPTEINTKTKNVKHSAEILIEMPDTLHGK